MLGVFYVGRVKGAWRAARATRYIFPVRFDFQGTRGRRRFIHLNCILDAPLVLLLYFRVHSFYAV